MNQENSVVNYSMALKNYNQNGRGRSMRKFCEDEGYVSWNPALPVRLVLQKSVSVSQTVWNSSRMKATSMSCSA